MPASASGTSVAPTSSACCRLPGSLQRWTAQIAPPPPSATTSAIVASVIASPADDRTENSSLRSTAVPMTMKLTSVANVVSAHTAWSKIPSTGARKYAAKPKPQRNHSIAMTVRASRSLVSRHERQPSRKIRVVAGAKNSHWVNRYSCPK
jgi:hypothetical protein